MKDTGRNEGAESMKGFLELPASDPAARRLVDEVIGEARGRSAECRSPSRRSSYGLPGLPVITVAYILTLILGEAPFTIA